MKAVQEIEQSGSTEYLTFTVNGITMAIPIGFVKEIVEAKSLSRLPMSPESVVGALNLRGKAIPVIDLKARLDIDGGNEKRERRCVVVIEREGTNANSVGVLVDEVCSVVVVQHKDIDQPPSYEGKIHSSLMKGLFSQESEFVIALELDSVLDVVAEGEVA